MPPASARAGAATLLSVDVPRFPAQIFRAHCDVGLQLNIRNLQFGIRVLESVQYGIEGCGKPSDFILKDDGQSRCHVSSLHAFDNLCHATKMCRNHGGDCECSQKTNHQHKRAAASA